MVTLTYTILDIEFIFIGKYSNITVESIKKIIEKFIAIIIRANADKYISLVHSKGIIANNKFN